MSEKAETTTSEEEVKTEETATNTKTEEAAPEEEKKSLLDKPEAEETPQAEPLTAEDLKFGEDFEVDEGLRDEFLAALNSEETDPKLRAQSMIDLYQSAMKKASEASSQAWADQQTEWQGEVKADEKIGGDKLQPTLDRIGRLTQEYGSDELLDVFAATGAGNNIHVIRFLDGIAAKLTEGGPVSGEPTSAKADAATRLFPSMKG